MAKVSLLLTGSLILTVFLVSACGGDSEAVPTSTSLPAATSQPTATAQPTAAPQPTAPPLPTATSALAATRPPAPTEPTGPDAALVAKGKELYLNFPDNVAPQALWCSQCHQIEGVAAGLIGPDHTHLATAAQTRVAGLFAEDYIRESIVDPTKRVAEGVERATAGLMTEAITKNLTDEQVDALVAFLLTLK